MKWLNDFFSDLGGSLAGRGFYGKALTYPASRAWLFVVILLFIVSAIDTFYYDTLLNRHYDALVEFFQSGGYDVKFEKGVITNLPAESRFDVFAHDTLVIWAGLSGSSVADSIRQSHPAIRQFFGPQTAVLYSDHTPQVQKYPPNLNMNLNAETLRKLKSSFGWLAMLISFLLIAAFVFAWSFFLIFVLIVPMLSLKLSKLGIKYADRWKLGMFLLSYHSVLATLALLFRVDIPYMWIYNLPLYVFVVVFLVRIESTIPAHGSPA